MFQFKLIKNDLSIQYLQHINIFEISKYIFQHIRRSIPININTFSSPRYHGCKGPNNHVRKFIDTDGNVFSDK